MSIEMGWRHVVYEVVRKIPKGKVSNYGKISEYINAKCQIINAKLVTPRMVGWVLHQNPDPEHIPCHRVVDRNGELAENYAFGGWREQKRLLLAEGVKFKNGRYVDLGLCYYEN